MYSLGAGLTAVLSVALGVLALLLLGGLLYCMRSTRARLRLREEELAAAQTELEERSSALTRVEGEVERLKRIPKAELLPMLKLAHEQRSPLAAIQNALDMLLQGYAVNDPELQEEMLNLARDRAAAMLERVNDFLRLGSVRHAEIERKIQPVQLLDILEKLSPEKRVRARWRAVEFHADVPESLPPVTATYEDIEHLLSNLINNAIKYTDPGGAVTVSLREQDGAVVGAVQDTGVGISPEDLPKIFDEFYRSESAKDKAHGTGLGLAIVKRVVDLYGGHLDVESERGKGSTFTFTFPVGTFVEEEPDTKTFRNLREEVIERGLCGQCSGCVSFCSAGKLHALDLDESGWPQYADENKCLKCGICYLICPLTTDLDGEVRRRLGWTLPIGSYRTITSARATEEAILRAATNGGVVPSLLTYMLDNYLIQGSIVSRKTGVFGREPLIATTREEILSAARARFAGRSSVGNENGAYTTYSPAIRAVKSLEGARLSRVAMVGVPCQVRTVRKMQCLGISPSQVIGYTIGQFCMEHFSFDALGRERLEKKLRVDFADIDSLDVREDLGISLNDGTTLHVPFEQVDEVARPVCLACTEYANDFADISVGGLGSPAGYATVLVRTEKGARVYEGALRQGYIEERAFRDAGELRSERTRMLASVVAFARRKRERGAARLEELATMPPV
jgi:coenzyme F420 hydrogenase subunit beta